MAQPPAPPPPPPGAPPPPPPEGWAPPAPTSRWYSLTGLTTALTILIALAGVVALLGIAAYANRVSVANDILDNTFGTGLIGRAQDADDYVSTVVIVMGLLQLAIGVLTIIWTWRAMKNNEALGRTNARFTPGWGIAGWLIPCANFVIPILIFQDLWRGSDSSVPRGSPGWRQARGSGLLALWWVSYLVASVRFGIGQGGEAKNRSDLHDLRTNDTVALVGMIGTAVAAIFFVQVIRQIAARQEATLHAQRAAAQ